MTTKRKRKFFIAGLFAFIVHPVLAQQTEPKRLDAHVPATLAKLILARFASGTAEGFAQVFPDEEGRALVSQAVDKQRQRIPGIGRVVWSSQDRAVMVLSGVVLSGNSGDETISSRAFSSFYEATKVEGTWKISRRLLLDGKNRIRSHDLDVTITPGLGLRIIDTMQITIGEQYGLAARLNHRAKISSVLLDGKSAKYEFGGGLLWIRSSRKRSARLRLKYSIDVEQNPKGDNSGNFLADAGHVRNQYFWHPFVDSNSSADLADFSISVHIPSEYHVTTSLPQTETVFDGIRSVLGRSLKPTFALSLLYDKDWQVISQQIEGFRFETFLGSDFKPPPAQLESVFRRTYNLLSAKFGPPQANYFAVAQGRARRVGGWLYRTNDLIVAGEIGGSTSARGPRPRAYFGHEVSHGWTSPTGPATNFLMEGWATYAESLLLKDEFGADVERDFWESQRNNYFTGGFEGCNTILNDPDNSGVAYGKGAWILGMLRDFIGDAAFEKGMRDYMKIRPGQTAGLEQFTTAMTAATGRDIASFLKPWVSESVIPDLTTRIENQRLIVTQTGPQFELPLEIELITAKGSIRKTVHLLGKEEPLDVSDLGAITAVHIDPDHRLLIKRHQGEVLHLEVRVPGAKSVQINGDFTSKPIAAESVGGIWRVDLPLTEGHYFWYWLIDGKIQQSADGTSIISPRTVQPIQEVASAYPH